MILRHMCTMLICYYVMYYVLLCHYVIIYYMLLCHYGTLADYVYYYQDGLLIYLSYPQRNNSLIDTLLFVLNPCRFAPVDGA